MYVPVLVCPESLGGYCRCIAVRFEVFLEIFMCYDPDLYQAIHSFFDSDVYVAVVFLVVRVIFIYYLLGNEFIAICYICSSSLDFSGRRS